MENATLQRCSFLLRSEKTQTTQRTRGDRKLKFQKTLRRQAKNLYAEILPRDDPYWYWSPFCFHNVWKLSKKVSFSKIASEASKFHFLISILISIHVFVLSIWIFPPKFFSNTVIEYTIICRSEEESSPKSFLPLPSQSP